MMEGEGTAVFSVQRWIPRQLLLTEPRLEDLLWDDCVRAAHERGMVPVGPVMIREATPEEAAENLKTVHPFKKTEVVMGDEVLFIAEVMVGASLE